MNGIQQIPEVLALNSRDNLIRLPGEQDVPVTPRIRKLVDSQPFQRLRSISQLGLVSLVYPGATHTRFEHSLGAYRMSLLFLNRLATNDRFVQQVSEKHAELFFVAALLHDIGHWPYCHPFEDMGLAAIVDHESLARKRIVESGIASIVDQEFDFTTNELSDLLEGKVDTPVTSILKSMLSGPIDVDKMDYLYRDSLHAGVPYGMHYDRGRLIGSLCLNEDGSALAIDKKGSTAAELMVFARYVMFSEVYWHHTVRAATAMLQRALFTLVDKVNIEDLYEMTDLPFQQHLLAAAKGTDAEATIDGLFGPERRLYKRLAQFTLLENPELFQQVSRRNYEWLLRCSSHLISGLNEKFDLAMLPNDLLIDAPPPGLEVQFNIDVRTGPINRQSSQSGQNETIHQASGYRAMSDLSPVVKTLAQEQFDNYVKRVRLYVNPSIDLQAMPQGDELAGMLKIAIKATDDGGNATG